ncbi:MAG: hypothetical protein AB7R90_21395 [Reyranellaceae bacterium]
MTTFAVAPDSAFRLFGAAAVYMPPAGSPVDVTVVVSSPSTEANVLRGRVARAWVADLRRSEVAAPAKGATLVVADCEAVPGGGTFAVEDFRADLLGLVWHLDLKRTA